MRAEGGRRRKAGARVRGEARPGEEGRRAAGRGAPPRARQGVGEGRGRGPEGGVRTRAGGPDRLAGWHRQRPAASQRGPREGMEQNGQRLPRRDRVQTLLTAAPPFPRPCVNPRAGAPPLVTSQRRAPPPRARGAVRLGLSAQEGKGGVKWPGRGCRAEGRALVLGPARRPGLVNTLPGRRTFGPSAHVVRRQQTWRARSRVDAASGHQKRKI